MFLKKIGQKRVSEKKIVHLFLGSLGLVHCCCMMSLDALEGCAKNPIKIVFFWAHPVARFKRNRKIKKSQKK